MSIAAQSERILVVDDDPGAREVFSFPIEELGKKAVKEKGPITDIREFIAEFPHKADAILSDYHLKKRGEYASFNGDVLVAECYKNGIPGLLCTQYTDVATELNRYHLRFIPSLLKTNSPDPDSILISLNRCRDEISGSFHPTRKPWRTLVRIDGVDEEGSYCHVIVPAWNPNQAIRLYFDSIPSELHRLLEPGRRLHALVNIGAESFEDVFFEKWEPE